MAARRTSSGILEKATTRRGNLMTIDPNLDLGNGYSVAGYLEKMNAVSEKLAKYNAAYSALDKAISELDHAESELNTYNSGILGAVKVRFGADSDEYELAGGTPTSKRKRPTSKGKKNDPPMN